MACDTIKIETLDADEVVSIVTQGPQGPSGAEAATLTTTGDLLYRAALANDRLPIGSEGQVLKVASGLPAWGNESGAVTSVNGETGAVVLDAADVGAAPATGISPTAISGTAVVDSDPRLSDARTPSSTLAHSSSHHTGGTDAIAPNEISAAWALETRQHSFFSTSTYTLAQGRNVQLNVSIPASGATGTITLPRLTTDLAQNSDDVFVVLSGTMDGGQTLVIEKYIWTGSSYIGSTEALVTTTTTGAWRFRLLSGQWVLQPVASHTHAASAITSGTLDIARIPTGTGSTQVALGDHTHADLHTRSHAITSTSDHTAGNHKVFYSNGSGEIVELALGNSGEVLTSNGATSAPSFAAASGGIGGSTGGTDGAVLRADGTGGSTAQGSELQLDDAVRAFSVTGDASTDVITATGHNYVNGQVIRFVGLAGGSGLSNATNYFVRDAATNEFKVATTSGGAAVNFTTNITSGSAIALQENVTLRVRPAKFAFTADASTDVITATGHTFIEHDPVSFSELVGGAGLNTAVVYYVRDISGDTFKISTSAGGTATNITTNYTGGNVELVAALVLTTPNMGSFIVGPKPDGTTHGGNIRGQGVIDIQPTRSGNTTTRVASGTLSIAIGDGLTASNTRAITIGSNGTTASGINSLAIGTGNTASARNSIAMGVTALADRSGRAFCHHSNSASGHRQELQFLLTRTTTNDTAVEMWADESENARVTIPSGKVMGGIVCVTGSKSDGSAVALYTRQFVIKNVGGTTTMPSQSTIGTDYEDNANTDITVEANDTNDAIRVLVKGISGETWRWTGWLHCTEHFYGT